MPEEKKQQLIHTASLYGMDPEAFMEYGIRCILEHEDVARTIYEAWKADPEAEEDIKLVCRYPVHENETEEEAFNRAFHTTESDKNDQGGEDHG